MTLPATPVSPGSVGISDRFLRARAPELARDIAGKIDTAGSLAEAYGLTPEQWVVLRDWPTFRQLIAKAIDELTSDAGIASLAARKAALAVERFGIADMAEIMGDKSVSPQYRIKAFENLGEVGKLTGGGGGGGSTAGAIASGVAGPLINIVFSNGQQFGVGISGGAVIEHEDSKS